MSYELWGMGGRGTRERYILMISWVEEWRSAPSDKWTDDRSDRSDRPQSIGRATRIEFSSCYAAERERRTTKATTHKTIRLIRKQIASICLDTMWSSSIWFDYRWQVSPSTYLSVLSIFSIRKRKTNISTNKITTTNGHFNSNWTELNWTELNAYKPDLEFHRTTSSTSNLT